MRKLLVLTSNKNSQKFDGRKKKSDKDLTDFQLSGYLYRVSWFILLNELRWITAVPFRGGGGCSRTEVFGSKMHSEERKASIFSNWDQSITQLSSLVGHLSTWEQTASFAQNGRQTPKLRSTLTLSRLFFIVDSQLTTVRRLEGDFYSGSMGSLFIQFMFLKGAK